jgi:hypothetical protein
MKNSKNDEIGKKQPFLMIFAVFQKRYLKTHCLGV